MSEKPTPSEVRATSIDEKNVSTDEKNVSSSDSSPSLTGENWQPSQEWLERFIQEYSGKHGGDSEALPAGADPMRTATCVFTFNEEASVKILESLIEDHVEDYSIDKNLLVHCRELIQGPTACNMEEGDWAYTVCKTAGMVNNWSPYAEVRSVTLPYDDPEEPCESFRAYIVGFFWVCVATAVNTCEFRRANDIGLSL